MNYRPYWKRHPWQRRLLAAVTLPLFPFLWVAEHIWSAREDLAVDFMNHIEDIWN